nr:MAG TPA: tail protein [Caudoviricetes sp.]
MPLLPESASVKAILNGSWKAEIQHPIDEEGRWKWIEEDAVVKLESFNGTQLFRIKKKAKSDAGVSAELEPVFMDAIDDCFLLDIRPTEKNGQQALDIMTAPNKKYSGKSNIKTISTAYYQTKNLIEAICGEEENSFLNRWGGEVLFDNYTITVNDRVGSDHGVQVLYGKNIAENGLQEEIDTSEVVTRIVPKAYNGYMMEGNEPWVDSPLLDKYPTIKYGVITFEDVKMKADAAEDDEENGIVICNTQEELNNALKEKCEEQFEAGIDKPKVTISADMVMLHDTELYADIRELEEVSIGDTVHCRHSKLDIVTDARVIELEWDCINEEVASVVLGDFQYNFITDVSSMINRVESAIRGDGTVVATQVQGILDGVKTQMRAQSSVAKKQNVRAMLFEDLDPDSPNFGAMCLGTMGFQIAGERTADGRDWDWTTFGTGQGFFADFIVAGTMLADRIKGGALVLGGKENGNGVARVVDGSGKEIVRLDKDGVYAEGKYVCDSIIDNRRVTIKDGTIRFSNKNNEGELCMKYVGNALLVTNGNEQDEKNLIRITRDSVFLDAENVGPGSIGKTGTAVFSNGTNLKFEKGFLVGGVTKEGAF